MELETSEQNLKDKFVELIYKNVGTDAELLEFLKSRTEKISYKYMDEEHKSFFNIDDNGMGFYLDFEDCIFLNPNLKYQTGKEQVLMHEMCHAYSKSFDGTGFFKYKSSIVNEAENVAENLSLKSARKEASSVSDLMSLLYARKNRLSYAYSNENRIINEAATEFYASQFIDAEPVGYSHFLPLYKNLSDGCGYDKLKTLYFKRDEKGLISAIKDSYHLKDEYLVKKLLMVLDASCDCAGTISEYILRFAYEIYFEMHINKIIFENNIKSNVDLKKYLNAEELLAYKNCKNEDSKIFFNSVKKDLEKRLLGSEYHIISHDLEKTKTMVNEFICKRLVDNDYNINNYREYKHYFKNNLGDVLTCLNQETYYKVNGVLQDADKAVNTAINFIMEFKDELDIQSLSKFERKDIAVNLFSEKFYLNHIYYSLFTTSEKKL